MNGITFYADLKAYHEPRNKPLLCLAYAGLGILLDEPDMKKASHKRSHSYDFTTHAHSVMPREQGIIPAPSPQPKSDMPREDNKKVDLQLEAMLLPPVVSCLEPKGTLQNCWEQAPKPQPIFRKSAEKPGLLDRRSSDISRKSAKGPTLFEDSRTETIFAGAPEDDDDSEGMTIMLRNIPSCFTQQDVLQFLKRTGAQFSMLYMPHRFSTGCVAEHKGAAYIHVTSKASARQFTSFWHRKYMPGSGCYGKPLNVAAAHVQGVKANMEQWTKGKTARIRNHYFRPWILEDEQTWPEA